MAEEKVNVFIKGEIVEATRHDDGHYTMNLPSPITLHRRLSSDRDGWLFQEDDTLERGSYFWMRMKNDGTVEYANDMTTSVRQLTKDYHPDFSDLGSLTNLGKEMYGIIEQLKGYEKLGVSPCDVLELRKKIMAVSLTMLGYTDVNSIFYTEPNPDESIMDLNHTIKYLERYPALAQYVTRMKYSGLDTVRVNIPEDFSKEEFKEMFEQAKEDYNKEQDYVVDRLYEIRRRRDGFMLPDFCIGLKPFLQKKGTVKRGEPTPWDDYLETTKKLGKLILGFNADLLPAHEKMRVVQSTTLNQNELLDRVASITEPAEMDEVLADESYFFMNESYRLSKKVQEDLEDDRTRESSTGKIMLELAQLSSQEAEERRKAIQDRHYYRNIYPFDTSRKKDFGNKSSKGKDDYDREYFEY